MSGLMWFILGTAVVLVVLVVWAVVDMMRGGREAPSTRSPRRIRTTYGAGYSDFLNWEEEWEWETVPTPLRVQLRRLTWAMKTLQLNMVTVGVSAEKANKSWIHLLAQGNEEPVSRVRADLVE